jgi:hypothetical protein
MVYPMGMMAESLSKEYEKHVDKKKKSGSFGEQLSGTFMKDRLKRVFPFFSS